MSDRLLGTAAALAGALGVAGSAAASHLGLPNLAMASTFALLHAPAILAAILAERSGLARPAWARIAAGLMALGLLLFSGALALGSWGLRPIPMAAPTGGTVLIAAWLLLGLALLLAPRPRAG